MKARFEEFSAPMRRLVLGLAGVVAIAAAAASLAIVRAPTAGAGERVLEGVRAATGLTVLANGASTVDVFPSPRVRVDGVSIAQDGEPPFAVASSLTVRLSLWGLLQGRLEPADATLDQPQIALDRVPYSGIAARLRASGLETALPALRVSDARLTWRDRVAERVEAGIALPHAGGALTLSGYGRFEGRDVEAAAQLSDLAAFERRESAPFRGRVETGGARAMFDGEASDAGGLTLVGDVSVRAQSFADTLRWLGAGLRVDKILGAEASFAGRGRLDASGLQISNGELDLGGETFLGAGRLTPGAEGFAVEATLDAGSIDLTPYFDLVAPKTVRDDGRWSSDPVTLAALRGWTLDLRLSADALSFGGLRLDQPAATAIVAKGGLDLSIGEASAYGGAVGGRLSLEPEGESARLRIEGAATDVALGDALQAAVGRKPISGALTAEVALESRGASAGEIARGLKGRIVARLADGALERVGRSRTLSLAGLGGRMAFSQARAEMTVTDGLARADPVTVEGPRAAFSLSGEASLIDRRVALRGFVRPNEGSWTLPVRIDGPLFAPKLKPDLSGAAPRGEARRREPRG